MIKRSLSLLALLCGLLWSDAQSAERQVAQSLVRTIEMQYLLYLPPAYDSSEEQWPLLLFLHGAGERGDDLEIVKAHGPPKMIAQGRDFPFVVVSPQCPKDEWWAMDALHDLLNEIVETYRIDTARIYVTGLSMGGYATWGLACTYPERFAAVIPICGGGDPEKASSMKEVPTWVFHGAKDEAVPLQQSQKDRDPMHPDITGLSVANIEMEAGDLLIFNSLLAHGVRPNRSKDRIRMAQYISMHPAEENNEVERRERIRLWREQDHPQRDAFPGDPREWERNHAETATLTELGEKLLGLKSWY